MFRAIIPLKAEDNEKLGEKLGENERKIIELITENTQITIPIMADRIGISTTSVENNIRKLKEKGLLKRMGSARGGYWKIVD